MRNKSTSNANTRLRAEAQPYFDKYLEPRLSGYDGHIGNYTSGCVHGKPDFCDECDGLRGLGDAKLVITEPQFADGAPVVKKVVRGAARESSNALATLAPGAAVLKNVPVIAQTPVVSSPPPAKKGPRYSTIPYLRSPPAAIAKNVPVFSKPKESPAVSAVVEVRGGSFGPPAMCLAPDEGCDNYVAGAGYFGEIPSSMPSWKSVAAAFAAGVGAWWLFKRKK